VSDPEQQNQQSTDRTTYIMMMTMMMMMMMMVGWCINRQPDRNQSADQQLFEWNQHV
jgi:hypothetical protein